MMFLFDPSIKLLRANEDQKFVIKLCETKTAQDRWSVAFILLTLCWLIKIARGKYIA